MRARTLTITGLAFLMLAPGTGSAGKQEHWEGTWRTTHEFGSPKLKLKQKGDDVSGTYHDNGRKIGDIWGTLSGRKNRVWSGRFQDTGASSKGKFSVRLQSDDVSFEGTFKTCGRIICSDPFTWHGEKN